MSHQGGFGRIFRDQVPGPRNGFEPREWQSECRDAYLGSVEAHKQLHAGNGDPVPQHRFTVYAGTGSGKTKAAALIASEAINAGLVKCVVVVCPNRSIKRKTKKDFLRYFGVDLVFAGKGFSSKFSHGIPPAFHGYIITYGHMMNDPEGHQKICSYAPTLVIFDEVHHLGDDEGKEGWGESAVRAFGGVEYIICLTGTPYRSDNTLIPFVTYEEGLRGGLMRFKADYTYSLGSAVADEICRFPQFLWHYGTVKVRPPKQDEHVLVSFGDDPVSEYLSSARLRGAVLYRSTTRMKMLEEALGECRRERRKVIIFLGGDTQGENTPTMDAKELLPDELAELGYSPEDYEIVTSDDDDAQAKIDGFGESDKWILISINMVSEGTDLPELSALIFLTSVTTKQSLVQRIGRILRSRGPSDPYKTALIFAFADPAILALSSEMLREIDIEQSIRRAKRAEGGGSGDGPRSRTEAVGVSGGEIEFVQIGPYKWAVSKFREMQAKFRRVGLPAGFSETAIKMSLTEIENGNIGGS